MASTIITITDTDEGVDVQMGFDPPIDDMENVESLAHLVAIDFVEYATLKYAEAAKEEADEDVSEE